MHQHYCSILLVIKMLGVIYSNLPTDTAAISIAAKQRKSDEPRMPFHVFSGRLQDLHFRLMFCMDRDCFVHLCDTIEKTVGRKIQIRGLHTILAS